MKGEYVKLKEYIEGSKNTVVVTGAGISYLYGMRRLKQNVGMMNARRVFSAEYVRKNPEKFYEVVKDAFLDATFKLGPSKVHRILAKAEGDGKISCIVTQNMDALHTIAGSKNVVEFQGSFRDNICIDCGARYDDYRVWNLGYMPRCEKCGAPLMPTSFCGKSGDIEMKKAIGVISEAELIIVMGTTGFRSEEYLSCMNPKAKLVQINPSATRFDAIADLNIREDAEEVLEAVL